jgi:hypothetical protein
VDSSKRYIAFAPYLCSAYNPEFCKHENNNPIPLSCCARSLGSKICLALSNNSRHPYCSAFPGFPEGLVKASAFARPALVLLVVCALLRAPGTGMPCPLYMVLFSPTLKKRFHTSPKPNPFKPLQLLVAGKRAVQKSMVRAFPKKRITFCGVVE